MGDFSQNINISRNYFKGRIELNFCLNTWGDDWIISFYGGRRSIGTVQIWEHRPELSTISQHNPPENEEYHVIKSLLEVIHDAPFNKILFYGGIHFENLNSSETDFILESAADFGKWILSS